MGQDYWIHGEAFNEKRGGLFLDLGANDGVTLSNTCILEARYKWTGICIEANPLVFRELRVNRRSVCLNVCLDRSEGEARFALDGLIGGIIDAGLDNAASDSRPAMVVQLPTRPLVDVLDECRAPTAIDYMSVDVEGAEE